jgi:hypothetical protein
MTRSLRTQQCVWPAPSHRLEVPRTKRCSTDELLTRSRPNNRRSTSEQCLPVDERHLKQTAWTGSMACQLMLLRKEVIQPHLPVRLPCYDFVPIARPTFDSSLHKGWATGFGCCQLS